MSETGIDTSRKYENIVYAFFGVLVVLLPFFNEVMRLGNGMPFSWCSVIRWWIGLLPFIVVFLVNNYLLVPKYLLKNRIRTYIVLLFILVCIFISCQMASYEYRMEVYYRLHQHLNDGSAVRSTYRFLGMPMPLLMSIALMLLMLAVNTAVIMIFKYIREKRIREALETVRLKDELRFLKAQINPHFFMNMLNNIHAMIELEPVKAQTMTLELSKLMRYVLYEGDNVKASFASEVAFISSYVALMRRRYPPAKVNVVLEVSENPSDEVSIPPMLFVTFVENAFKHGVSYQTKSEIFISLTEKDGRVCFVCRNTKRAGRCSPEGGVGLENVRRRLDILYPENYDLKIEDLIDCFNVELTIPSL